MERKEGAVMKYIDTKQIPKYVGSTTAEYWLLPSITDYFADETHQAEFEEWLKNRKKQEENA